MRGRIGISRTCPQAREGNSCLTQRPRFYRKSLVLPGRTMSNRSSKKCRRRGSLPLLGKGKGKGCRRNTELDHQTSLPRSIRRGQLERPKSPLTQVTPDPTQDIFGSSASPPETSPNLPRTLGIPNPGTCERVMSPTCCKTTKRDLHNASEKRQW